MDPHHLKMLQKDAAEAVGRSARFKLGAKLAWYALSRPLMHAAIRRGLLRAEPRLAMDPVFKRINMFLNGDGGMFKKYAYGLRSRYRPLRGASVLVPGVGYGQNILQLAAFRPKEIVAFDLFDFPEEWEFVTKKAREMFGVPISFYKGDFDALPADRRGSFDFAISDAVLEHVPSMAKFAADSRDFLKTGGVFYASFGPLWYGPRGDHADWGADKMYDHILLSKEKYSEQLKNHPPSVAEGDSCDTGFMIQTGLFSYARGSEYLEEMDKHGFEMLDLRAKISPEAVHMLAASPQTRSALDAAGHPLFDRYSGGMYIWARKK